ncbi:MAG: hypothetical protein BWX65_00541 [Bacteroidetes bacterium ADurb.Bin057]|nr:MAG: hypothetical protein BWX65_00541 [Bacteroidetes bacterium ADurb.Bin057]
MMLPMAISAFFFFAAIADVANSGSDVPNATIVTPITDSLTFHAMAIFTALSTIRLPPIINPAKPTNISTSDTQSFIGL